MSVTIQSAPDLAAAAPPTKAGAVQAALDRLNGKTPETPVVPGEPVKVVAEPAATSEPAKPVTDVQVAVELERSKRELVTMRSEMQQTANELRAERAAAAARAKDPMQALKDAGHDVEALVMQYVSGDAPAKPAAAAPAAGGSETEQRLRDKIAEIEQAFTSFRDGIMQSGKRYNRDQRLESLRGMTKDGDDFEALRALEAYEDAMGVIEATETGRESPLDEAGLRETLTGFEKRTRDNVSKQLKALGNTKWAKQVMREILEAAVESVGTATPTVARTRSDLMNGDGAPATRTRGPLNLAEIKEQARAKATAALERRRQGLT